MELMRFIEWNYDYLLKYFLFLIIYILFSIAWKTFHLILTKMTNNLSPQLYSQFWKILKTVNLVIKMVPAILN